MHAAPRPASRTGGGPGASPAWTNPFPACPRPLPVMTVLAYGADMAPTLGEQFVSSQNGFGADLLEALTAVAELVNTGRSRRAEGRPDHRPPGHGPGRTAGVRGRRPAAQLRVTNLPRRLPR